jgi:predicted glycosyltransferase
MKLLFHLGHPAHFHLFKNVIGSLKKNNDDVLIVIKKKDILEELLQESDFKFINILPNGRNDSKIGIALGQLKQDFALLKLALKLKPDLLIGTSAAISHIGKILNIPSINLNEDDAEVVPLYAKLAYPWASCIVAPRVCSVGKWDYKKVSYEGYHELAYLHPNNFKASREIASKYVNISKRYFILRFAKLNAHHDKGVNGISDEIANKLVQELLPHGTVFITSERKLGKELEKYRISVLASEIHHVMAFASLYIGDSQTMAAESGVLGVPFIRFNDFVGKISYLKELEEKYNLGYGISPSNPTLLYETVNKLMNIPNLSTVYQLRKEKMLSHKIDLSKLLLWLIKNYPQSIRTLREDKEYQFKFR